ncbi:leupaxin-like isoform X2 [Tachypleus tridentatus]|uniref:leupaxin-like isoform X2 n=1 Tax=Tachypleus tridentatus TaxID=6853 RepID=UPI003FD3D771
MATQAYHYSGRRNIPPAYALLADLQNTTVHLNHSGSGYQSSPPPLEDNPVYSQPSVVDRGSPIYQNQQVIREVTMTTTPIFPECSLSPKQDVSLENNLSELDTLLEDLNSARFMTYPGTKGYQYQSTVNGPSNPVPTSPRYHNISPSGSTSSSGIQDVGPSVESLLDELQNAVPETIKQPTPVLTQTTHCETVTAVNYPSSAGHYSTSTTPMASSATKELDDLMASLSDFKLNNTSQSSGEPAYAKPHKLPKQPPAPTPSTVVGRNNQLDSMLGTLQCDMNKQGVNTTAKGHCAACNKPIVGQVVTALGKTWHPEHFTCNHCNQELGTKNFFERDGEPYCETDYHNIFSPRCAYCNGPILDKCVTALDKTWHPEHFFCTQCGRQFDEEGFHEQDGKPYCQDDYFELFAPKCGGCNRPITENYISALNNQWHPECFVCMDCRQSFNGGSFYDHEGQPYCETHYHAKRGSLCAGCHKPISGRCITAMFKKFHPEHFVCSFCLKQLNKGTFKEQNDKPYCHVCFEKLFG